MKLSFKLNTGKNHYTANVIIIIVKNSLDDISLPQESLFKNVSLFLIKKKLMCSEGYK